MFKPNSKEGELTLTTFVLVHGAWHGGWCWKRVAEKLRVKGHDVYAPTLTGLGDRHHLISPQYGLSTHIDDITNLLSWEQLEDVVLCGHSYGGMVITGVADKTPERLKSLVYLDAFVPKDGQSAFDLIHDERAELIREKMNSEGDGWRMMPTTAEAFGIVNPKDQEWVDQNCVPMAVKAFEEPIRLSGRTRSQNQLYILAENYHPSSFHDTYENVRRNTKWRVYSLPTGHDVMITMPSELVEILLTQV